MYPYIGLVTHLMFYPFLEKKVPKKRSPAKLKGPIVEAAPNVYLDSVKAASQLGRECPKSLPPRSKRRGRLKQPLSLAEILQFKHRKCVSI